MLLLKIWWSALVITAFMLLLADMVKDEPVQAAAGATILAFLLTTVGCIIGGIWL